MSPSLGKEITGEREMRLRDAILGVLTTIIAMVILVWWLYRGEHEVIWYDSGISQAAQSGVSGQGYNKVWFGFRKDGIMVWKVEARR